MEIAEFHSEYKGYRVVKVTQPHINRVTYDIKTLSGEPVEWALQSLAVARATISALIGE